MENKSKILIFVVAYNAEQTIRQLLDRLPKEAYKEAAEILIADDASQDNTYEIASEYKKKCKLNKIKVVKHKENKGYGGNQKWGYNYAIKNNFDLVVMIHGDAQYPSEYISRLVQKMKEEKADFVFGSRIAGHPMKGGMPLYKFIGNKFLTFVENLTLQSNLSEFHSGFRAYSVKALKDLPFNENSDKFHFDSEIITQLIIARKKIDEITIPTFYGKEKCNVNSIKYGLNILKVLGQYLLHKSNIKKFKKFNVSLSPL